MLRQRFLWLAAAVLLLAGPLHGETRIRAIPQPVAPDGRAHDPTIDLLSAPDHLALHGREGACPLPATNPVAAVWHLYFAIERGDVGGLAQRLTEDYRFISNDPGFLATWPDGFDREAELNFVTRITEETRAVEISYDDLVVDPPSASFRAAPGTYRVRVKNATMRITDATGNVATAGPSEHEIEVVCAVPPAMNGRGVSICSIRRWIEHASAELVTAAAIDTADTSSSAISSLGPPDALDIRVLSNGRRDGLSLAISLPLPGPARVEMFDLAGRRVDSRELHDLPRGTHAIGVPAMLPSGVYWARVRQAGATRSARVVVVR